MTAHMKKPIRTASRCWKPVVFLFLCVVPTFGHAQAEKPEVTVSMYFASETDACPPSGYRASAAEAQSSCRSLTFDNLEAMVADGTTRTVQQRIPPERLRLGERLLDSIDAYVDECPIREPCLDASRRYSIILTFEVADVVNREITITRVPPEDSQVPPYSFRGELSPQGRWIDHQRADTFLPSYRVRWRLEIGQWTWRLGTER